MTVLTAPIPSVPAVVPAAARPAPGPLGSLRPFTVDEYHKMIDAGVLSEDDPVELLEGWVVFKMPRNPPHDGTIGLVKRVLDPRVPSGWHLRIQLAITTVDSEPEPDFAIVRGDEREYLARHPGPDDIALLVEVANSSLDRDREDKARIYARAGIPAYWIVNVSMQSVEVFTNPSGPVSSPAYRQRADYPKGTNITFDVGGHTSTCAAADLLP